MQNDALTSMKHNFKFSVLMRIHKMTVICLNAFLCFSLQIGCYSSPSKKPRASGDQSESFKLENSKFCSQDPSLKAPPKPYDPTPQHHFSQDFIQEKLSGPGLTGWVHGAASYYSTYSMTYRSEEKSDALAFFKSEQFSLIPADEEIANLLKTLRRHDKISIYGKILDNNSSLAHIVVSRLDVIEKYPNPVENTYSFDDSTFKNLEQITFLGQVHANSSIKGRGRALIVDWKDILIPVAVPDALEERAKDLIRGDIIQLTIKAVATPHSTKHYVLDESSPVPLTVIDDFRLCHGQRRKVTGYLVKFDKSPAIRTDVYAIRVVDSNGIARNFTLFPSVTDQDQFVEIFKAVVAKSKKAWDHSMESGIALRNFNGKPSVQIEADGVLNIVSSEQANAQIYLDSAEQVTFK
jgi:hypothetical protein